MKVYGTHICIDCRNYQAIQASRGFEAEFIDITADTANLKEFLALRDHDPVFAPVREHGGIGIPLFVREDARPLTSTRHCPGSVSRRCARKRSSSTALAATAASERQSPPAIRPGGFCCADNDLRTKIQQSEHLSLYGQGAAGV